MDFVDLAQNCAPSVAVADLAAIVQVQSDFDPYVIRLSSGQGHNGYHYQIMPIWFVAIISNHPILPKAR